MLSRVLCTLRNGKRSLPHFHPQSLFRNFMVGTNQFSEELSDEKEIPSLKRGKRIKVQVLKKYQFGATVEILNHQNKGLILERELSMFIATRNNVDIAIGN